MKEKIKKNKESNCPKWFKCVACVIIYNHKKEILLGKRKKEPEKGKWGFIGGSGAFGKSKDLKDFAKQEMEYDIKIKGVKTKIKIKLEELKYFKTIFHQSRKSLKIEIYFSYNGNAFTGRFEVTGEERAPEKIRWFSIEEIRNPKERYEIAFNNAEIADQFYKEILNRSSS